MLAREHRGFAPYALVVVLLAACSTENVEPAPPPPPVPCSGKPWSDEVCIQGGEFTMGHDAIPYEKPPCTEEPCGPGNPPPTDFTPPHKVKLKPFFIDRYPATNGQYKECFDAGMCPADCTLIPSCAGAFYSEYRMTDPALADYPVATIMFDGAEAYCRWVGKRLPTEAEWERAARGPQSFDYPWGNEPPDCVKYVCDPGLPPFGWSFYWLLPVGANPGDVSAEGAREMVTSAVEFVHDLYDYYYYQNSPYDDPQGPSSTFFPSHTTRGDLYLRGYLAPTIVFNGTGSPLPAWVRQNGSGGGVRCARTDDGSSVSREAFYQLRRRDVPGFRGPGVA
jgi:formylglycine-generating enzyme required for sulfatase activity